MVYDMSSGLDLVNLAMNFIQLIGSIIIQDILPGLIPKWQKFCLRFTRYKLIFYIIPSAICILIAFFNFYAGIILIALFLFLNFIQKFDK